ncbi:hypothetical protein COE01_21245 [Bacillus thuringiensis]|uniref:JmjC domain-containing protein n=1 Tax=Bacillus thuringiensis TaxID=1428 RepID=UPI000BFA6C95|nr:cupin domain-containing protein [Bacillus thuringiensis]PEW38674.1 hypothetical protein CN444_26975 [Bacillus thuringiensis]PEY66213.1 hypothetical protein CN352_09830 [Bacillus thuringiensis]PFA08097.1 hypothetical protein CN379_10085 [Bacillus thuringiensis]PFK10607.1 hypothetical protein COJ17_17990 [Bacillus thuringiensis]PFM26068.1 hypothetical protein COJ41_00580 [Bacillus thuringiensis]
MEKTIKKSVLEDIISPVSLESFLTNYWPKKYLLSNGDVSRFDNIFAFNKINTVEDIIKLYKNPVMVVGDAVIEESEGITDRILVSPAECLEWYEKGAALEFDFTDIFIPEVRKAINQLKKELRLPEGTSTKAIIYAAKNGGGFKTHFDAYTNFIFQIKGRKIWKLMDNNNVDNPMQHYDLAEYPYKPEELQTYWKGEGPDEELSKGEIIELIPGSMLYLPRGLWHSTKSNEETLAFNITFGQPTWLELLLFSIRKELITDPKWRELACNYSSLSEAEQKNLDTHLLNSLQEMQEKLNNLKPEDIYKCQNSDFDIYQSTQLVFRQLLSR